MGYEDKQCRIFACIPWLLYHLLLHGRATNFLNTPRIFSVTDDPEWQDFIHHKFLKPRSIARTLCGFLQESSFEPDFFL